MASDGPASFDVQRVVEYLGLPSQGEVNALALIGEGVERDCLAFTGWPSFLVAAYTRTFTLREPQERLFLPIYPVVVPPAVTVTIDGTALDTADFSVDAGPGALYRIPASTEWPRGIRHIVVAWSAGLAASAEAMPGDLVLAMVKQTAFAFKEAGPGGRLGRRRDSNAQGQVVQEYDMADWAPGVLRTLRRYQLARLG